MELSGDKEYQLCRAANGRRAKTKPQDFFGHPTYKALAEKGVRTVGERWESKDGKHAFDYIVIEVREGENYRAVFYLTPADSEEVMLEWWMDIFLNVAGEIKGKHLQNTAR